MRVIVWMAALAAVIVAGVECKRSNGAYCDDARPCPNGFACDLTARECHVSSLAGADLAGLSTDMAGCTCSNPTPICVAAQCVSCLSTSDPEGACAAASSSTPHCSDGECVGCRDATDCSGTTPFCDATTHACRGCIADSECPSLVCDLIPDSSTHGQCIPTSNVVYVNPAGTNGDGLTPATAKKKVQDGIQLAAVTLNPPRLYVHIAAATYDEGIGVNAATVSLVGATGATIHRHSGGDVVGAQNAGSLTARNIIVTADNGNGVNCQTNGTIKLYGSQLVASSQLGLYALSCNLTLDGVWVNGNAGGGLSLSGGNFTIINTIITNNTGAGGVSQVTTSTTMAFVNNTIADNVSGSTANAGINCAGAGAINPINTIFYNNKLVGGAIAETNCPGSFNASDDVTAGPQSTVDLTAQAPGFKGGTPASPASYHLLPTSPCIGEGTPTGAPDHDFDFEPRPDAKTGKPDIGADEVQQ